MTTMQASISNDSSSDNISSDSSFDIDDLFSSTYTFIYNNEHHHNYISIKEDHRETLSHIYHEQLQISSTNNPSEKSHLSNLKCAICDAPATGHNFNQITCGSCKAFFRRNALRDMVIILANITYYTTI